VAFSRQRASPSLPQAKSVREPRSQRWVCHDLATRSLARSTWRSRNHSSDNGQLSERARKWRWPRERPPGADDDQGLLPICHCLVTRDELLTSVRNAECADAAKCQFDEQFDRDSQGALITLIHTKYNPPRVCVAPHRSITLARRWRVDYHVHRAQQGRTIV
jgi:hypothetical protein